MSQARYAPRAATGGEQPTVSLPRLPDDAFRGTLRPRHRDPLRRPSARTFVLLAIAMFVVWMVVGLVSALVSAKHTGETAQQDLAAFRAAFESGDEARATALLHRARSQISDANDAIHRPQVRLATVVPGLGGAIDDLDTLLSGARAVTDVAGGLFDAYADLGGANSRFVTGDQINLGILRDVTARVDASTGRLQDARAQLAAVHGGALEPGVTQARDKALRQVDELSSRLTNVQTVLHMLPPAIGADGPRFYVIAVLNPAELRFSGGAPLAMATVGFDKGRFAIINKGATSAVTRGGAVTRWTPVKGDPWFAEDTTGRVQSLLVNSTFDGSWPVAGEELLRAYQAQLGLRADGVIAIDPVALANVLNRTGPIDVPGYGKVTAQNLVQVVLQDSYQDFDKTAARHAANNDLMNAVLTRLLAPGHFVSKIQGLAAGAPGRHLQMYFRDPVLEQFAQDQHVGGALPTTGNLVADFTQNTNGSKVDVYQTRSTQETVTLAPDGSAQVTRAFAVTNNAPPYAGPGRDPGTGYDTRIAGWFVGMYLPKAAEITAMTRNGAEVPLQVAHDAGLQVATQSAALRPGQTLTMTVSYRLPHAARQVGDRLVYDLSVIPQAVINPGNVTLRVDPPAGWNARLESGVPSSAAAPTDGGGVSVVVPREGPAQLELLVGRDVAQQAPPGDVAVRAW